jgi:hypothetical protein
MLRRASAVGLAAAIMLAAAPAARADDDAVRQTVIAQETKIAPDNAAFSKVVKSLTKSKISAAKKATDKLIADVGHYRFALIKVKASTSKAAKGRTELLSALKKQRTGLRKFNSALKKYTSGDSAASIKASIDAAVKELTAGRKQAVHAGKLLGLQ